MDKHAKKTFGEAFFSELNVNDYLHTIYQDILYNYARKLLRLNIQQKSIPIDDALAFSDLLSKSNHPALSEKHQMWAQEIITMLLVLDPGNSKVSYYAGSVLEAVSNYQGIHIAGSPYNGTDFLDRLAFKYKKHYYAIPGEKGKYFTMWQKKAYDSFDSDYFSFSGPASMRASDIFCTFIRQQILKGYKQNFAIVVPSRALINNFRARLTDALKNDFQEYHYYIITTTDDMALRPDEKHRNYIIIMTPDRLLSLLYNKEEIHIDFLFIDEAQILSGDDNINVFYYQLVHMLSESNDKPKIIFSSQNVPNPEIYLTLIPDIDAETLQYNMMSSSFSTVSQVKFLVESDKEITVFNEYENKLLPLGTIDIPYTDLTNILLRLEHTEERKKSQSIVYLPSPGRTVEAARNFAERRASSIFLDSDELMDLSRDIKYEIHDEYFLADLIPKGIAYYIGFLPTSIKQRIDELFLKGKISTIFCTTSMADIVNLPADYLFLTDYKIGKKYLREIDFRNLIGNVGRINFNLYGHIILIADNHKDTDKYEQFLKDEIMPQKLSIESSLTNPQKKNVIDALVAGTVEFKEHPRGKQSKNSYNMMRKFGISLLTDILKNRNTIIRREFKKLMKSDEEEKIRQNFINHNEYLLENDITVSVDQSESLYHAIANEGLVYPEIKENGSFDYDKLSEFLGRLLVIFKWDIYEADTLGYTDKYSQKHSKLSWYQTILDQWVCGHSLCSIITKIIYNIENNPQNDMFIERRYEYYDGSREHKNIVIGDVLTAIDEVILDKLSNYLLIFSQTYKRIKHMDPKYNWYEYVTYGSTDQNTINIEKHGFTRESAIFITDHPEIIISTNPIKLSIKAINRCNNQGLKNDMKLVRYNIPELFI